MRKHLLTAMAASMALAIVGGTTVAHAGTDALRRFKLPYAGSVSTVGDAFQITNTGSGNAIEGGASGPGHGILGTATGEVAAVEGDNAGPGGLGVLGSATARGVAGVEGAGGQTAGVLGTNSDGGAGVEGTASTGPAGYFVGNGSNAALELKNGAIKIDGAGTDTPTPVFVHLTSASNLCGSGLLTVLDNPLLNGNANATVVAIPQNMPGGLALVPIYGFGINGCPANQWEITALDPGDNNVPFTPGEYMTVLVFTH